MSTKTGLTKNKKVIIPIIVLLAITVVATIALAQLVELTVSPTKATSGQQITITVPPGVYKPYATVAIYFNNTSTGQSYYITSVSANASGGVHAIIQVPYSIPAGTYNITAVGLNSTGLSTPVYSTTLFNETFVLSPGFGSPGSTVQFTGFGFYSGETVNIYFDGQVVATVIAGTNGYISGSFTVPSTAAVGSHTVVAVGQTSGITYVSLFYVTVANITVLNATKQPTKIATVGSTVYVNGSGFPANQYVVLCFNNIVVNTAYTNSSGTFITSFTVPQTYYGTYPVVAMATVSPVPIGAECPYIGEAYEGGYASASLTVVPSLTVNVTTTCPTYAVNVTGYGFPANTPIEVLVNGENVTPVEWSSQPSSLETSSSGTFWAVIQMPSTPGTYEISTNVTVTYNGVPYPTPVNVTVSPSAVYVNGTSSFTGYVGETVTVSGICLPPNQPVNLYISNTTYTVGYPGIATTNSSGGFSVNINLPLLPPGKYNVSAVVSGVKNVVNASVTIPHPTISLTASLGYEGMCFNITGNYLANLTLYSITVTINGVNYTYGGEVSGPYSNYTVGSPVENLAGISCGSPEFYSNSSGTVVLPVFVPVIPPGKYTVYVNVTVHSSLETYPGVPSTVSKEIVPTSLPVPPNDTLYRTASFTVQQSYIYVPSVAVSGQQITIQGYNFYPNTPVTILVNGKNVTTTTVGSNGQFTATYVIPSYLTNGTTLTIVAEENYTEYIAGPNAAGYYVGNATATVTVESFQQAVLYYLEQLLQCCNRTVVPTLQQLMGNVSAVYKAVLGMNSTLTSMGSTLSSINSTVTQINNYLQNTIYPELQNTYMETQNIYNYLTQTLPSIQGYTSLIPGISTTVNEINSTVNEIYSIVSKLNLTAIQNMLSSINSTLGTINSNVLSVNKTVAYYGQQLMSGVSALSSAVASMNSTITSMLSGISSTLSSIQSILSTINSNVLSVNSTVTYYGQQLMSGIGNIQGMISTLQSMMSSQYSTIQGELGAIGSELTSVNNTVEYYGSNILSAVQSINTTVQSVKTVVPSVSTGYGTLTFTSPGTQTIYQSSTVGQVTITLYYSGYSTVWIYVYPIPGDTTHYVKLQVSSSAGYTVTVSGWRVDVYVTSASSVSPVTVYYSYTAIS